LLVAQTVRVKQCGVSGRNASENPVRNLPVVSSVRVTLAYTPLGLLSVTSSVVLTDRCPSEECTVSVPQHKQEASTYVILRDC